LRIWFSYGFVKIDYSVRKDDLTLVLNALEKGDSEQARKALENHVEMFANQMNRKFQLAK
jgi:DNA-binding GntR family transcriptional regulator